MKLPPLPHHPGPHKVDYADFQKALELACHYQNRCCDLEEIIELFCLDAEAQRKELECMKYPGEQHERFALV